MWKVTATIDGERTDWPHLEIEDGPASLKNVLDGVGKLTESVRVKAPFELMHHVTKCGPLASGDSIELWGEKAIDKFEVGGDRPGNAIRFEHGRQLQWFVNGGEKHASSAWHDDTLVAVPLRPDLDVLDLEYVDREEDTAFGERMIEKFPRTEGDVLLPLIAIEWRAYVGTDSGIIDGAWAWGRKLALKGAGVGGLLVGKVVRLLSLAPHRPNHDPLQRRRQRHYEQQFPTAALACPDLRTGEKVPGPACIVVVHGTFSCGLNILQHFENGQLAVPTRRFEHDTFCNVTENAKDLADLIHDRVQAPQLLLVAHSRGGLVACVASALLAQHEPPPAVDIWTYGTPHHGTPLVHAGNRVLGWLYKLGTQVVAGIPAPWPTQAAMGYLLGTAALPSGIEDMAPGSSFLDTVEMLTNANAVASHAGDFDPMRTSSTGYGLRFKSGFARGAFGSANDLVVPTASASAVGRSKTIKHCDHFSYFARDDLRDAITAWNR
ncbi:MAG: esterase/lipase family protein [Acidobacteriota bacterium]